MTTKPESVADVLAEWRGIRHIVMEWPAWVEHYADRIEAAHAREIAEKDAEIERLKERETELRREWWLAHGCSVTSLYGDDGEMQCGKCLIDFRRMAAHEISSAMATNRMRGKQ